MLTQDLASTIQERASESTIIVGDFNAHHPNWSNPNRNWTDGDKARGEALVRCIEELGIVQHVQQGLITRHSTNRRFQDRTIDLVWSTQAMKDTILDVEIDTSADGFSDHMPIATICDWVDEAA